uniref:tRNA (guanine(9)-N(1))-methyltransferase n=1 Tax=Cyprinus carpio carpio TaxID=630221 RepID=A0A8C1HHX4_CYPCA
MATDMADKPAVQESSHECANSENETLQTGETETLSKRQKKSLLKNQQWEEQRELRKQKRKERKQQRKLKRQAQAEDGVEWTGKKRLRRSAEPSSLRLVIDCSFDNLMLLKIRRRCCKVLAVNHGEIPLHTFPGRNEPIISPLGAVFEIILAFLEKQDWQDAFFTVLPQRKRAVPVGQENKLGDRNDEEDSDEDSDTEHPIAEKRTDSKDQSESKEEEHKPVLIQSDSIERNTA